jgi:hypothetical protein
MVPKQLANTIEFIFERSMPTIGAAAKMVIGPPANARAPKGRANITQSMQAACRTGVASSIPVRVWRTLKRLAATKNRLDTICATEMRWENQPLRRVGNLRQL